MKLYNPNLLIKKIHIGRNSLYKKAWIFVFLFLSVKGFSQSDPVYDEVPISLYVMGIGNTEMPALIFGEEAYLSITDLFDFIKIKNGTSDNFDAIEGYFMNPKAVYLIDKSQHLIHYQDQVIKLLSTDIIQAQNRLYLKLNFFSTVFGLDCVFSFRNLSITLKPQVELPAIKEIQQQLLRNNISQLIGEKKADTVLQNQFKLFNLGSADWSVTTSQASYLPSNLRANLHIGTLLAGGEANININYYNQKPFDLNQQYFRWRYVNDRKSIIRQITAGRINTNAIATIFAPVNGIQITNTPATKRKSFTSYRYTGNTEPGWGIELYVNNILVNYSTADASGFFAFDIPLVYGNSAVVLRFYGLYGEEITKEENINIPFNFLPKNHVEYDISAGFAGDAGSSIYSKGLINYGINNRMTIGAGMEYLSSVMQTMPLVFFNASARLGSSLILNGEYTKDVRFKGNLNYRLPMKMQLEINFSKYDKDQKSVFYNYLEERAISFSAPVRFKNLSAFSKVSFTQLITKKAKFNQAEWLISLAGRGISSNIKTYAQFSGSSPAVYSEFSFSYTMPGNIRFTPQLQYRYNTQKFGLIKLQAEKNIFKKANINLAYEKNIHLRTSHLTFGFRYDLSFAQTFFSLRKGKNTTTATQHLRGSLLYAGNGIINPGNQSGVGKGGLIVLPFIDLNNNGYRESNEPKAFGLTLGINGGRVERNKQDTTILIKGLDAFTDYYIELDNNSFDNIAWRINHPTVKVFVEPNYFKLMEVPVSVLAEVSGIVNIQNEKNQKGISRILINIYNSKNVQVAQTLTESDGYFNYLGLTPGSYLVSIDTGQLRKLNMTSTPESLSFDIKSSEEGVIADGFNFVLSSLSDNNQNAPNILKDTLIANGISKNITDENLAPLAKAPVMDSLNSKNNNNAGNEYQPRKNNNQNKSVSITLTPQSQEMKKNLPQKQVILKKLQQKKVNDQKISSEQDKIIIQFNTADQKHVQIINKLDQIKKDRQKLLKEKQKLEMEIKALRLKIKQQKR